MTKWFWVGGRDEVCGALTETLGEACELAELDGVGPEDLLVIDALADSAVFADGPFAELEGRHVFAAVRWLEQRGHLVYVVVDEEDRIGPELARFCLARGVLRWNADQGRVDLSELGSARGPARRPSVDELLRRVEGELAQGGGVGSTLERLLRFEQDHSPLQRLQDPETGLFDGPYATLKIDEEWKRAMRFHQPLSLVLLDLGEAFADLDESARPVVLADSASVFLNECRDIDVLSRFTPSIFLFLLPGTGPDGAEILARRMLDALQTRLPERAGLVPAAGIATVPSSEIPDRKAFLVVAEACLRRARATGGAGQVATTWQ